MPSIQRQPKVVQAPKTPTPQTAQPPAPAAAEKAQPGMEKYRVRGNQTLSHIAQEAYGQASKWPELMKANPGIKLRDANTPIIRDGDYLRIPKLEKGWTPKNPVTEVSGQPATAAPPPNAVPPNGAPPNAPPPSGQQSNAPASAAPVAPTKIDEPTVEAFTNVSSAYDKLEGKLKGMQSLTQDRGLPQIQDALAEKGVPKDKYFQDMTADVRTTLQGIHSELAKLNPDQRAQMDKLLATNARQWSLSSQLAKPFEEGNALRAQFDGARPDAIRSLAGAGYSANDISELKKGVWNPVFNTVNANQVVDMGRRLNLSPTQMTQALRTLAEQKKSEPNAGRNYVDAALTSAWQTGIINKNQNAAQLLQTLGGPSASPAARDLAAAISSILRTP